MPVTKVEQECQPQKSLLTHFVEDRHYLTSLLALRQENILKAMEYCAILIIALLQIKSIANYRIKSVSVGVILRFYLVKTVVAFHLDVEMNSSVGNENDQSVPTLIDALC